MIISDGYNGTPSASRMSARTRPARPSPMYSMPKRTPSRRSPKAPITATARRSTSPRRPASNVRNSSSRPVSSGWFTARNTALKRGSTCCARSASNAYSAKSTNADIRPMKRIPYCSPPCSAYPAGSSPRGTGAFGTAPCKHRGRDTGLSLLRNHRQPPALLPGRRRTFRLRAKDRSMGIQLADGRRGTQTGLRIGRRGTQLHGQPGLGIRTGLRLGE